MKRFLSLMLLLPIVVTAQENRLTQQYTKDGQNVLLVKHGQPKHTLLVRQAPQYTGNAEWLEVVTNYGNLLMKPLSGIPPKMGSIITEVNAQSTKDMTEELFYRIIDNSSDVALKYKDGEDECTFSFSKVSHRGQFPDIKMYVPYRSTDQVRIYRDNDIDFSKYRTYDYLLTDIKEKDIAQEFMAQVNNGMLPLKRDINNPDLLIKVSFDENRNISSTYVPPSTRTENLGSTTTQRYSYLTNKIYYETQNESRVVREGDYTRTTVTNQFYFEVAFLDTKMMNNTKQTIAPVVWSLTYKDVVEGKKDIFAQVSTIIKEHAEIFPRTISESTNYLLITGICFDEKGGIADVLVGSNADKAGIKAGDKLILVNRGRQASWEAAFNGIVANVAHDFTIQRGRKKIVLKNIDLFGWGDAIPILNMK